MDDRIGIDIDAAIKRRKDTLLLEYEERTKSDTSRAARRAQMLERNLETAEQIVRRDAERLEKILNGDMPPHLVSEWLLRDTWTTDECLLLLAGLEPASVNQRESRERRVALRGPRRLAPDLDVYRTLSGLPLWEDYSQIIPEWEQILGSILIFRRHLHQRLTAIWESGSHPDRPTPLYCVEWAQRKGFEIGWLHWAEAQGLIDGYRGKFDESLADTSPLEERERTTLLTIIGALAREAGIDVEKPSKAGDVIEKLTEQLGARVAARTIETHIKRVKAAIDKRAK